MVAYIFVKKMFEDKSRSRHRSSACTSSEFNVTKQDLRGLNEINGLIMYGKVFYY